MMNENSVESPSLQALFLIHDGTRDLAHLSGLASGHPYTELTWDQREVPPPSARVLVCLPFEQVKELGPAAVEKKWEFGILPHPGAKRAFRPLGVKGDLEKVFQHYLEVEPISADVLTCNGEMVFSSVLIGEMLSLRPHVTTERPSRPVAVWRALKAIKTLRPRNFKLTTGKDRIIEMAAIGMVIMEHTQGLSFGRILVDKISMTDGRMTMMALAPRSVISFLALLVRMLMPWKFRLNRLPGALGIIRTERILIESAEGIDFSLDGTSLCAKAIELQVGAEPLAVLPGPALTILKEKDQDKDQIKVDHLPRGETASQLDGGPLPLFNRASESEYKDLFVQLRENAKPTGPYLVLMVLSVLLALAGLFANSAPVIIGAMILAPLMSPIISLAMGLARMEVGLIRGSARTLIVGIGTALFFAVAVAALMPLDHLTPEMRARVSPTLLDLSVAVIAGIAGAYAHAKEGVAKSLAGVAIAVALVPPLAVVGIGIGWLDWEVASGSFLLFSTNLVGIALAASATFLVLGFAPFHLAKRGLISTLLLMMVICIPLYISFDELVDQGNIMDRIPSGKVELSGEIVNVEILEVGPKAPHLIRVILSSPQPLNVNQVDELKRLIAEKTGVEVILEAQFNLRR